MDNSTKINNNTTTNQQIIKTSDKPKSLMQMQQNYISSISDGLKKIFGNMSEYQAVCGYNMLNSINVLLSKEGLNHTSPQIDRESINDAIKFAMVYQLNTDNREVFVIIRNEKRGNDSNFVWVKKVEVKPQYRGQLKIVSCYGKGVKKVYPEWIVRAGDEFTYPKYKGVNVVPPEWTPHGYDGQVERVIVPIEYENGFIDYRIAERESVATNIKAQIKQSLMKANDKDIILEKISNMTLDQLLTDKSIAKYVNDTYTGLSSEEMIITKLVINATKRVAIDYQNAMSRELIEKTYDNADVYIKNDKRTKYDDIKEVEEVKPTETQPRQIETKVIDEENGEVVIDERKQAPSVATIFDFDDDDNE